MNNKRTMPFVVSIIIISLGVFGFINIKKQWESQNIIVDHPIITRVSESSDHIDLKSILHQAEKHVMQIEARTSHDTTTGSGFVFNGKGDIITNAHVIKEADAIYVRTSNAQVHPAAVVGIGEDMDIAVIRVPELAGEAFLPIERNEVTETGDEVIALGSPHGFQNTVTLGIISGVERNFEVDEFDYTDVYQISAQITHGNSGGPLINRTTGHVIGINSVGTEDGTIGFSIPMSGVIDQVEQWSREAKSDELEYANISDVIDKLNKEEFKEDTIYLIDYFFESIQMRDYISAYALLGSDIQSETSYAHFRDNYIHIVELDHADTAHVKVVEDVSSTTLEVMIKDKMPNEKMKKSTYIYEFNVGYENDQLKILSVKRSR